MRGSVWKGVLAAASCQPTFHPKDFNVWILSSAGERTVGSRGLRGEIIGLRILKLWKEARKRSKEHIIPRAKT